MCGWVAEREFNLKVIPVPAKWKQYGKAAGTIRNQQMLDEHPDIEVVYAFHDDLPKSKGTKDMCQRADKAGKIVFVVDSHGGVRPYAKTARPKVISGSLLPDPD